MSPVWQVIGGICLLITTAVFLAIAAHALGIHNQYRAWLNDRQDARDVDRWRP